MDTIILFMGGLLIFLAVVQVIVSIIYVLAYHV